MRTFALVIVAFVLSSCGKNADYASTQQDTAHPACDYCTDKPYDPSFPDKSGPGKDVLEGIKYDPALQSLPTEKTDQERLDADEAKLKTLENNQAEFCRTSNDPPPNCFGLGAPKQQY